MARSGPLNTKQYESWTIRSISNRYPLVLICILAVEIVSMEPFEQKSMEICHAINVYPQRP